MKVVRVVDRIDVVRWLVDDRMDCCRGRLCKIVVDLEIKKKKRRNEQIYIAVW